MLARKSYIDPLAVTQLEKTSMLPGIDLAVGMPDLHPGGKFPIGCVFATTGIIYPALIGGDIGTSLFS